MREDLIKILANIGDDYAGTIEKLEEYIRKCQDIAVERYSEKQQQPVFKLPDNPRNGYDEFNRT